MKKTVILSDVAAHWPVNVNMSLCSTTFEFAVAEVLCGPERPIHWLCLFGHIQLG